MDKRISYRGGRSRKGGYGPRVKANLDGSAISTNDGLSSIILGKKWTGDWISIIPYNTPFLKSSQFSYLSAPDRKVEGFFTAGEFNNSYDIYHPYSVPENYKSIYGARLRPEFNSVIGYGGDPRTLVTGYITTTKLFRRYYRSAGNTQQTAFQYYNRPLISDGTGLVGPFTFEEATKISCGARKISIADDCVCNLTMAINGVASSSLTMDLKDFPNSSLPDLYGASNEFPTYRQNISMGTIDLQYYPEDYESRKSKYVTNSNGGSTQFMYLFYDIKLGNEIIIDVDNTKDCYLPLAIFIGFESNNTHITYPSPYVRSDKVYDVTIASIYGACLAEYSKDEYIWKYGEFEQDANWAESIYEISTKYKSREITGSFEYGQNKNKPFKLIVSEKNRDTNWSGVSATFQSSLNVDIRLKVSEWEPFANTTGSPVWDTDTGNLIVNPFS